MPIKLTCPHCGSVHRIASPYPMPGAELHCDCGRVLVVTFPPDLMARMRRGGARFQEPVAEAPGAAPYQPAPTPARRREGAGTGAARPRAAKPPEEPR